MAAGAPPSQAPALLLSTEPTSPPAPELRHFLDVPTGPNPIVRCLIPSCGWAKVHKARGIRHLQKAHSKANGVAALLKSIGNQQADRAEKKKMQEAELPGHKRARTGPGPMDLLLADAAREQLNRSVARWVLARKEPFSVVEDDATIRMLQEVMDIARSKPGQHLSARDLLRRTAFTERVIGEARIAWESYRAQFVQAFTSFGGTLLLDGRSDANQDPTLFLGLCTSAGFLWCTAVHAGPAKKGQDYLAALLKRASTPSTHSSAVASPAGVAADRDLLHGFAAFTFASIQDNAVACVNAGLEAQADPTVSLVYLNCIVHALSLYPAWLFRSIPVLGLALEQLETLTSFWRKRPRAKAILKPLARAQGSKAVMLLRLVPTRFLLHFMAFSRALRLRLVLIAAIESDAMAQYADDGAENKAAISAARDIIFNVDFWNAARFLVALLTPIYKAVRFFDRSESRSYDVRAVMELIADSLAAAMGADKHMSSSTKMTAMELYQDLWMEYERPGQVASYMLNPQNHEKLTKAAGSVDADISKSFKQDFNCVLAVGEVILRRYSLHQPAAVPDLKKAITLLHTELVMYFYQPASLELNKSLMQSLHPEAFWLSHGVTSLSLVARVAVVFPSGTSDLERSHKINAQIHTDSRASLTELHVQDLTMGNIAISVKRLQPMTVSRQEWFAKFSQLSDAEADAADEYYAMVREVDEMTEQALRSNVGESGGVDARITPSTHGSEYATTVQEAVIAAPVLPSCGSRSKGLTAKFRDALTALREDL
jgi:hypothetical protein